MAESLPKNKKGKKWLIILLVVLGLLLLSSLAYFLYPSLTAKKGNFLVPKKQIIEIKKPKPISEEKVTKKISAKDGGEVKLTSKGVDITLFVPPGALKEDTDVGLTPLEESPLEGDDSTGPDENNPPQPPEEPPNQPPDQPPDQPPEQPPDQPPSEPPWVWVDPDVFARPVFIAYTQPLQLEEVKPDLSSLINLSGQTEGKTPKPRGTTTNPPGGGGQVLVHIGDGVPGLVSTVYFPGGFGGPIIKGGATGPKTIDPPTAKKILDQAVANGNGACTPEFINAYVLAIKTAQAAGKTIEASAYQAALEKCKDQEVGFLKRLCETDRRLLRRKDFEDRISAISQLPDSQPQIDQMQELKKKCIGQYWLTADGINSESTSGVEITSNLESSVCGYVDEEWKGTYRYQLLVSVSGGSGHHIYEGEIKYKLPYKGGIFNAQAKGSHSLVIGGTSMNVPLPDLGFGGRFDGAANVHFDLYPGIPVDAEIVKKADSCDGWIGVNWVDDTFLPPLVPLPK